MVCVGHVGPNPRDFDRVNAFTHVKFCTIVHLSSRPTLSVRENRGALQPWGAAPFLVRDGGGGHPVVVCGSFWRVGCDGCLSPPRLRAIAHRGDPLKLLSTLAKACALLAGVFLTLITLVTCASLIGRNTIGVSLVGDY